MQWLDEMHPLIGHTSLSVVAATARTPLIAMPLVLHRGRANGDADSGVEAHAAVGCLVEAHAQRARIYLQPTRLQCYALCAVH